MSAKRIYLAGPDVFLRDAFAQADKKRARCAAAGYVGVFPFDTVLDFTNLTQRDKAMRIYHADIALMDSCDICLAQMTPFRGPSMDVGTAYEMGYMRAQGKPVLGYTNVTGDIGARTAAAIGGSERLTQRTTGAWEDPDQLMIEGMGMIDNLMLDGSVITSGFEIEVVAAAVAQRYHDLTGFDRCLAQLKSRGI